MRVRLRLGPNKTWYVESKEWWHFSWSYEQSFCGDDAYERAHFYARILKNPTVEEVA